MEEITSELKAFVLRQSPGGTSVLRQVSLPKNLIVNGWADAFGLLQTTTYEDMREILKNTYYTNDPNYRGAGYAAGTMWHFLKTMAIDDYIVVPGLDGDFYLAQVTGPAYYDANEVKSDTAYRRPVKWLNNGKSIRRELAPSRLRSRMKIQQTCVIATDLLDDIFVSLREATRGKSGSDKFEVFDRDVREKLIPVVVKRLREGFLDDFAFEALVARVLKMYGAVDAEIVARRLDKGVDIRVLFPIADGLSEVRVAVQVKHHSGETDHHAIDQLIKGMQEEDYKVGWVISSGSFTQKTEHYAEKLAEQGFNLRLIDGEELSLMMLKKGF